MHPRSIWMWMVLTLNRLYPLLPNDKSSTGKIWKTQNVYLENSPEDTIAFKMLIYTDMNDSIRLTLRAVFSLTRAAYHLLSELFPVPMIPSSSSELPRLKVPVSRNFHLPFPSSCAHSGHHFFHVLF